MNDSVSTWTLNFYYLVLKVIYNEIRKENKYADIITCLIFGVLGYFFQKYGFPVIAVVLAGYWMFRRLRKS